METPLMPPPFQEIAALFLITNVPQLGLLLGPAISWGKRGIWGGGHPGSKVMSSWRASPGQQGGGPFMGSGNSAKDRRARWITTIFPEGDERMQTCTPRSLA